MSCSKTTLWALALLVACEPTTLKFSAGGGNRQVLVVPGEFFVTRAKTRLLAAVVAGDANNSVNWQVDDPNGGSVLPNGEYSAPDLIGVFKIVARSRLDSRSFGEGYAKVVDLPTSPELETDAPVVTLGDATLKARVKNPVPDMIYQWTVQNGTLLSTPKGTEIEFRADQLGFVALVCHVENPAGDTTRPGQLFVDVVEPLPASYTPDVLVPLSVRTNRQYLRAYVQNPQIDLDYTWTLSNGTIDAGQGSDTLTFTAGDVGTLHLEVRAATAAGVKTVPTALDIAVVAGGDATVIGGVAGGAGLGSGTGSEARFSYPSQVARDSAGNVYVLNSDSYDVDRGYIKGISRVHPDGHVTVLGTTTRFNDIKAIAADSTGYVYVVDVDDDYNAELYRIHRDANAATAFEPVVTLGSDPTVFYYTTAMTADTDDNLYLATSSGVYAMPPGGDVPSLLVGDSSDDDCIDGDELTARFDDITALAVASTSPLVLLAVDSSNDRVRRIAISYTPSYSAAVTTLVGPDCVNTLGDPLPFHAPFGVDVASNGDVYVTDSYASSEPDTVWVIPHGAPTSVRRVAGPAIYDSNDPEIAEGTGEQARFSNLRGVAVTSTSEVLVADSSNHSIRRISGLDPTLPLPASAATVQTFAGSTASQPDYRYRTANYCNDDQSNLLRGLGPVAVDRRGRIVVSDNGNCRFRMFDGNNPMANFAGNGADGYYGVYNGLPFFAQLSANIEHLAVERDGSFVFTENVFSSSPSTFYRQVRRISPDGLITSVAGGYIGAAACSYPATYVDDRGASARFCDVRGISVDPSDGIIYVVDGGIGTSIRAILDDTTVITIGYFYDVGTSSHELFYSGALAVGRDGDLFYVNASQDAGTLHWHLEKTAYSPDAPPARTVVAGNSLDGGPLDGACLDARFLRPSGMAYDADTDTMYVGDFNLVRRIRNVSTPASCVVDTIAGVAGERGYRSGMLPARFNRVRDVALTPARDLVVTDDVDNVVVLIRL